MGTPVMNRKRSRQLSATVKMDAELHRLARTVAAYADQPLQELLDDLLRPQILALYQKMLDDEASLTGKKKES